MACRAETAMAYVLQKSTARPEDAGSLLRAICQNEADLGPNEQAGTLTVRMHPLAKMTPCAIYAPSSTPPRASSPARNCASSKNWSLRRNPAFRKAKVWGKAARARASARGARVEEALPWVGGIGRGQSFSHRFQPRHVSPPLFLHDLLTVHPKLPLGTTT